jgi:hypothetical protein
MADIARRSPDKRCPRQDPQRRIVWAVAWAVMCGAHPRGRPRWNQPRRAQPDHRPGLACAAATNERSNRR